MNHPFRLAALALSTVFFNSTASEHYVDVDTHVPAALAIMQQDGTPLRSNYAFRYLPLKGIEPIQIPIQFVSNESGATLQVSVAQAPVLRRVSGSGDTLELTVRLDQVTLGAKNVAITGTRSSEYPNLAKHTLIIAPLNATAPVAAGQYQGTLSLRVSSNSSAL